MHALSKEASEKNAALVGALSHLRNTVYGEIEQRIREEFNKPDVFAGLVTSISAEVQRAVADDIHRRMNEISRGEAIIALAKKLNTSIEDATYIWERRK